MPQSGFSVRGDAGLVLMRSLIPFNKEARACSPQVNSSRSMDPSENSERMFFEDSELLKVAELYRVSFPSRLERLTCGLLGVSSRCYNLGDLGDPESILH